MGRWSRWCIGCAWIVWTLAMTATVWCQNWPSWRGPFYTGVADGSGYPTRWSKTEGVLWAVALPGLGGSTPCVWNGHIFVTCGDSGKNAVLCFDSQGKAQWTVHLGRERPGKHRKGSGANPSPVTDGERVYVYFKSGDLACLNFQGDVLWQKNLQEMYGEDTLWWDLGTSPVLTARAVVVACIHSGPSYLAAFDKVSGELLWKQDRNLNAPDESAQTYSTPIPVSIRGRESLVVLGADHVTAHDAATGKEIWRVGGLNPTQQRFFRSIASPVIVDGIVVAPYARGRSLTAIRLDGEGDLTQSGVLWKLDDLGADVPTPAALDGRVYLCSDRGDFYCLQANSGKILWQGRLERSGGAAYSSSPIIADGKIYCTREDGLTTVLELTDTFKVLATNRIDEFVVASLAFADGRIYLRTAEHLYCIGK
jgi:outer membrane protein assembly factor BamB